MTLRDLLDAERGLGTNLSLRNDTGSGAIVEHDLAQAWIDGDRELVLRHVRKHQAIIRLRSDIVKSGSKKEKILEWMKKGLKPGEIAELLDTTPAYVSRVLWSTSKRSVRRSGGS